MSTFGQYLRLVNRINRTGRSVYALRSPKTAVRRAKNIIIGRALARAGFFRWLWR
jgi:hypothetical protein